MATPAPMPRSLQRIRKNCHNDRGRAAGYAEHDPRRLVVTNPALAILSLHGRNRAIWNRQGVISSSQRFDYNYSDDELAELAPKIEALVVACVHVVLNNNSSEDQRQLDKHADWTAWPVGHKNAPCKTAVPRQSSRLILPVADGIANRRFAAPFPGTPHDNRWQPCTQVFNAACAGAADAEPRLLDGIVGLVHRPEHSVGHPPEVGVISLELLREPFPLVHRSHFLAAIRHSDDE
jgi:hypothetical protein